MISTRKLIKLAKKWQRVAIMRRKRVSFPESNNNDGSSTSYVARKGHFVVYTADLKRFIFPLSYLESPIIRELLEISQEEFGMPRDGPIRLPCDATFMQQIISMIQGSGNRNLKKALLMSISAQRCAFSCSIQEKQGRQQFLVCSF